VVYIRLKKIGSRRYVYLVEGRSENGRVRQKTLAYLGPMVKIAMGVPDEIMRKVDSRVGKVDWAKINTHIRKIPIEFEELLEIRRKALPIVLAARQNRSRDTGRGNRPRVEANSQP